MARRTLVALALILGLSSVLPRLAAALSVEEAIDRFFRAEQLESVWFAPNFLQAVPFEQLQPIRQQLTAGLGGYTGATSEGERYMARFEEGRIPVYASLDDAGRFTGLRLLMPIPKLADFDEVAAKFEELPGEGHLLVTVNGDEQLNLRADEPFAVGSAFKLLVLKVLLEDIETGVRAWSDVVELSDLQPTLGEGGIGAWPTTSPLTLHTAALLMISQSDNSATDLLIQLLGAEKIAAADASARNRPFLSTREAFLLKDTRNAQALELWRSGGSAVRRHVLQELSERPLPSPELFAEGRPVATDVEWFFTARELCELIAAVQQLDLMAVNPGVVQGEGFQRVAYKGGSEPGVLNFTTWVRDERGREICVCATRNADEAIELQDLAEVVMGAFEVVREQ